MSQKPYEHIIKYVTTTPANTNKNVLVTLFNNIKNDEEEDGSDKVIRLVDWEGTILKEYTKNEIEELVELPTPDTFTIYNDIDHELLLFQEWNWSLADIKTWLTDHTQGKLNVGAIYTTTDGQDHNYWASPRGEGTELINRQKRATASVGDYAFVGYHSLTSISVPDGVTSIGGGAFSSCHSLISINIPDSVTSIGDEAFSLCESLTSINIPDGVTSIGDNTFSYCSSLTSINIPDGVISIGNYAFCGCYSLTSINVPDGVTSIGDEAFSGCGNLFDILLEGKPIFPNFDILAGVPSTVKIYVPRENLSWFEAITDGTDLYGIFVAIEDNIEYLESLGYNVDKYKN